jgi:hypothetical protein
MTARIVLWMAISRATLLALWQCFVRWELQLRYCALAGTIAIKRDLLLPGVYAPQALFLGMAPLHAANVLPVHMGLMQDCRALHARAHVRLDISA